MICRRLASSDTLQAVCSRMTTAPIPNIIEPNVDLLFQNILASFLSSLPWTLFIKFSALVLDFFCFCCPSFNFWRTLARICCIIILNQKKRDVNSTLSSCVFFCLDHPTSFVATHTCRSIVCSVIKSAHGGLASGSMRISKFFIIILTVCLGYISLSYTTVVNKSVSIGKLALKGSWLAWTSSLTQGNKKINENNLLAHVCNHHLLLKTNVKWLTEYNYHCKFMIASCQMYVTNTHMQNKDCIQIEY